MEGQLIWRAKCCRRPMVAGGGGGGVYRLCGPIILKGSLFVSVQLGPIFKIYYAGGFAGGGGYGLFSVSIF